MVFAIARRIAAGLPWTTPLAVCRRVHAWWLGFSAHASPDRLVTAAAVALLRAHLAAHHDGLGEVRGELDRAVDTLILDAKQRAHIDQRDHAVRGQIFAAERAVEDVDELLWRVGSGVGSARRR